MSYVLSCVHQMQTDYSLSNICSHLFDLFQEMLKEFDVNNDGVIDCDEFLHMLGKTSKAVLE